MRISEMTLEQLLNYECCGDPDDYDSEDYDPNSTENAQSEGWVYL